MKKAKSLKTYGRTASRIRESIASLKFDEIMKQQDNNKNSPFGTSDSSTGSCKDLEKKMDCKPRRRRTKGKRVIMTMETNNSFEGHSHSPKEEDNLGVMENSASLLGLSSCERPPKTTVLKSQSSNIKPKKKAVKKPCSRKKADYTVADKENLIVDKTLDLSDIAQDSFVIEPEHAEDTVPQSSTPTSLQTNKPVLRLNIYGVDISNIESDCESDPSCSIIHDTFFGSDSHSSVHSNVTLRGSLRVRYQKHPSLWDQLIKNKISQSIQSFDDVLIAKSFIDEKRLDNISVEELEELPMWKKHSTPGKFEDSNDESLEVSHAEESVESSDLNHSECLFEASDSEGEEDVLKSMDTDDIISHASLERLKATLDEILEEDEDCIEENSQVCGQADRHSSYEESKPHLKSQDQSFYDKLSCSSLCQDVEISAEEKLLSLCDQTDAIKFSACIPQRMMSQCVKIGEGVYGEVFRSVSRGQSVAIKIVPIEGNFEVNDCPQKKFEEILPEVVIAKELSDLAHGTANRSASFCQVNRISCVRDNFPAHLLDQWDNFSKRKPSENDRPDMFPEDQLFMVFEFADGGSALEKFKFSSHTQGFSALRQVVYALAVAESALEFEHRDLHIANILVKECKEDLVSFVIDGEERAFPSEGVCATIIDFTISRLKKDGCAVFCDVSTDDGLFKGTGDIQFDVYRNMKEENHNDWSKFCPYTNILWVHYVCEKLNTVINYKDSGRGHRDAQRKLRSLLSIIQDFTSCQELARDLSLWVL